MVLFLLLLLNLNSNSYKVYKDNLIIDDYLFTINCGAEYVTATDATCNVNVGIDHNWQVFGWSKEEKKMRCRGGIAPSCFTYIEKSGGTVYIRWRNCAIDRLYYYGADIEVVKVKDVIRLYNDDEEREQMLNKYRSIM